MNHEILEQVQAPVKGFSLPRYHEIPDIGLYLEQTSKYVSECLQPFLPEGMTGSMISNYVKRGVLESPHKKQYSREQIARLIWIAAVKAVLPMENIKLMFTIERQCCTPQTAYDYFCSEFENVLEYVFGFKESLSTIGTTHTDEKFLLRNIVVSAAHALYLGRMFDALHDRDPSQIL